MRYRRPQQRRADSLLPPYRRRRRRRGSPFLNPVGDRDKIRIQDEAYIDRALADAFKAVHGRSVPECLEFIPNDVYNRLVNAFQAAYEHMADCADQ